ncbi:MAG: glycerophosphodiester phosphodiesterase family protein [Candidatus Limnocylindria bacterium]
MAVIVAHRGASRQAPENTMEAFRLAVDSGADAIELDVHLSADGQLAVIHDETLDRTTDRIGTIASQTMDEIRQADAGATFARDDDSGFPFAGRGLTVPTLPEVLEWLPEETGLVIEIKARTAADAVVEAVAGHRALTSGRLAVISFDEASIDRIRELNREIKTGYLLVPTQPIEPALVWATEHGHVGVFPWEGDLGMDPLPLIAQAAAFGREIGCYVVNDPEEMKHLSACGLWGFVTDVPDVARDALGR